MASSPAAAVERDDYGDVVMISSSSEDIKLIPPPKNARFQLCCFQVGHDGTPYEDLGNLFGFLSATGIRGKLHLFSTDPSLDYDSLFHHEHWANEGLYRSHYLYPKSSCSIPASTYVEILSQIFLSIKDEHKYIEVSNGYYPIDFQEIWRNKDYEGWDSLTVDGENGWVRLFYYAIRSAVNAVLEISFEGDNRFYEKDEFMVRIYAYYGDDVKISPDRDEKHNYKIKIFEAGSCLSYSKIKQGKLELMQPVVAVPDHTYLIIDSYIFDCHTGGILMNQVRRFRARLVEHTDKARVEGFGQFPEHEALQVLQIGLLCTQASAALRPSMTQVVEFLTTIFECSGSDVSRRAKQFNFKPVDQNGNIVYNHNTVIHDPELRVADKN